MKQCKMRVTENVPLAKNTWRLRLEGPCEVSRPGQFVNISVPGFYLRRPISVCDGSGERLTLIYKVVGGGTEAMSRLRAGEELDLLTGLGNGFDLTKCGERPVLVGGGAGVAPLYLLARELLRAGKKPAVCLGFNESAEIFLAEDYRSLGLEVLVTTVDGSSGLKGFVTEALSRLAEEPDYLFCCGPLPMMKAVYRAADCPGQFSLEERMGCGFGACMGCSIETKSGARRVCKDGPVFERGELLW